MGRIINQKLRAKKSEEDHADILDNNSVANSDPEENPDGPPYISWIRPESISGRNKTENAIFTPTMPVQHIRLDY